jgi:hypothetical protein
MIKLLKTIISNMKSPKWRIIYTKSNGETDCYVITNPTLMKGSNKTTFSNNLSRMKGLYKIGFRACVVNREFQPRSFHFNKIRHISKVSIFEEVVA